MQGASCHPGVPCRANPHNGLYTNWWTIGEPQLMEGT